MEKENKFIIRKFIKVVSFSLLVFGVCFLYLLQKVRGRELDSQIQILHLKKAALIKKINFIDFQIERLKSPERIIRLAEKKLKMYKTKM